MPYRVQVNQKPYQFEIEEIGRQKFLVREKNRETLVEALSTNLSQYTLLVNDHAYDVVVSLGQSQPSVLVRGQSFPLTFERTGDVNQKARQRAKRHGPYDLKAGMPGKVVKLLANPKDRVTEGQALLVLEAMKMENELAAPAAGIVQEIHVQVGQSVENGQKLVTILVE